MTVRSGKCERSAPKPAAVIGWPIMNSGGRPSAVGSGPWTSYARAAPEVSKMCVVMTTLTARPRETHRRRRHQGAYDHAHARVDGRLDRFTARVGGVLRPGGGRHAP